MAYWPPPTLLPSREGIPLLHTLPLGASILAPMALVPQSLTEIAATGCGPLLPIVWHWQYR